MSRVQGHKPHLPVQSWLMRNNELRAFIQQIRFVFKKVWFPVLAVIRPQHLELNAVSRHGGKHVVLVDDTEHRCDVEQVAGIAGEFIVGREFVQF